MIYYNENDKYCVKWLKNLITEGLIPVGDVDDRDIKDVRSKDLIGYTQCHFFAGIAGWPLALQLSGWSNERSVWTGSCPCQPFSVAGKKKGQEDARHLWPEWFRLIRFCRPATIFGEQVASAVAQGWLDDAANDLEAEGYAVGSAVLPACSVGAPHKRDRLFFMGNTQHDGLSAPAFARSVDSPGQHYPEGSLKTGEPQGAGGRKNDGTMANANANGFRQSQSQRDEQELRGWPSDSSKNVADAETSGETLSNTDGVRGKEDGQQHLRERDKSLNRSGDAAVRFHPGWEAEPGMGKLAHGISGRMGKLRALGNAIVPAVADEFIKAYLLSDMQTKKLYR